MEIDVTRFIMRALLAKALLIVTCPTIGAEVDGTRSLRPTIIEDFDDGTVVLRSFPGEDVDPDEWSLDSKNTFESSPFALRLDGNTWKIDDIQPVQIDSGDVWEVAAYTNGTVDVQGFGVMDSANVVFYSLAGTKLLDITTWVTVYQGAFPSGQWNTYQLPVADDWLASFGYLPLVDAVVFVSDRDDGGSGPAYFDHIVDITDDLPIAPIVEIAYTAGRIYRDSRGTRNVDVQFSAAVTDPDSDSHSFFWDFGDDSTSSVQNPSHTYVVEDDHAYTVILAVVDSTDLWGWASCAVQVDPGPTTFPITVNFVGDIMLARGYEASGGIIPTQGVEAIFAPTLSVLGQAADVTVANMESPLTDATVHHPTKPIFFKASPENVAGLVYAGIDVVTIANNHIYDYLTQGMQQTQAVLDSCGIFYSGAGMNSYEAYLPVFHTESGASIAFLASSDRTGQYGNYQPYLNAGFNKPGFAYMTAYDIGRQITAVRQHADLVVVETHSGDEYGQVPREGLDPTELADPYGDEDYVASAVRPTSRNRTIRQAAIDAGADLVVSHHPHIIQGFESYSGRLIAHSLGNFTFDLRYPETFPTMVLNAKADGGGFYEFTVTPAYIDDWIPVPARGALGLHLLDYLAYRSRELDTYLYVDREQTIGVVRLDTLTMPVESAPFLLQATASPRDGYWMTDPLRLARHGSISSVDAVGPEGGWEYRLGRERIWWGSCEDEGCTLWYLDSPSEWYDSTESYHGARSIRHRRYPDSPGIVVTNLQYRLKRFEDVPTTLQGFIKTQNGAGVTIEILFHTSRYGADTLGTANFGMVNGTTGWSSRWTELSIPDDALYYNVRPRSDCPDTGVAYSWFDDVSLVEWTQWMDAATSDTPTSPNEWYYIQLRRADPAESVNVAYTETENGAMYYPMLSAHPCALHATVMAGYADTAAFSLANTGTATVHVALEPDVPWAAPVPRHAIIPPGARLPVATVFNAAGLDTGGYQGTLAIRPDDPAILPLEITLSMRVDPLSVRDLAISVTGTAVHLSWSPVDGAVGYGVYRAPTICGPWELLGTCAVPSYADSNAAGLLLQAFYRVTILTAALRTDDRMTPRASNRVRHTH